MRISPICLLVASLYSPVVSAMSLGEGQILSQVGENFSANISLLGEYDKDVRFSQVRVAECRASIMGRTPNACDSIYEGPLIFLIKKRPDGQYFLRVNGERGAELYYRIVIKSRLPVGGTVYNAFEFLPEFKPNQEAAGFGAAEEGADKLPPVAKVGGVSDKIIAVLPEDTPRPEPQLRVVKPSSGKASKAPAGKNSESKPKKVALDTDFPPEEPAKAGEVRPAEKIAVDGRLQISRQGNSSDDIQALKMENQEIERQIGLLEKQIGLLKEVAKLKSLLNASSVPDVAAVVSAVSAVAPASATAPVQVATRAVIARAVAAPEQPPAEESEIALWKWVLLVIISLLSTLWVLQYRKRRLRNIDFVNRNNSVLMKSKYMDEKQSLDLTNECEARAAIRQPPPPLAGEGWGEGNGHGGFHHQGMARCHDR